MYSEIKSIVEQTGLGAFRNSSSVSGGSINQAFKVETSQGLVFIKLNSESQYPGMFEAESKGLQLLSKSPFYVPQPKRVGQHLDKQFIVLEWIEKGLAGTNYWDLYGEALAQLHSTTNNRFGLNHNNYIGSLSQPNNWTLTWSEFYQEQRLIPQIKLAANNGLLTSRMHSGFESLFKRFDDLMPKEKPSLIHGDLWGGNMMVTHDGRPSIFDPAVYYGHREMDLAMMTLFGGGFGERWVDAYNQVYPLQKGWKNRIEIGLLYPLMVHVNLFGSGYQNGVEQILTKYD